MTARKAIPLLILGFLAGLGVAVALRELPSFDLWSRGGTGARAAASEEIMVMRTKGGLLEVSRIEATEVLDTRFVYSVLGIPVGETVPQIRVPAVYRYQVELAPEWRVLRTGEVFTVVAPAVQPGLPVAVDLGRMEKEVSGTWVLLPFTEVDALDELERSVTARLAGKARSPAYMQLQRKAARETVTEFVKKWLVTQAQWHSAARPRIRVLFADEPVGSIDALYSGQDG